jgi:Protein of unknown function (DUF3237)
VTIELDSVMTVNVICDPPIDVGAVTGGFRRIIPIIGGTFEGPDLRGVVLAGGADWNLQRRDRIFEAWARYTLRTDDDVLISVTNAGLVTIGSDGVHGRTSPCFEVAGPAYVWLTRSLFIGTLTTNDGGDGVALEFFRVS